jgi:predicted transcriptional regulator
MRKLAVTIKLDPATVEELKLRAAESNKTVSEVARLALEDALNLPIISQSSLHEQLVEIRKLAETAVHLSALSVGVSSIPHDWSDADIAQGKQKTANRIINGHEVGLAVRQKFERTVGAVMSKEITFKKM